MRYNYEKDFVEHRPTLEITLLKKAFYEMEKSLLPSEIDSGEKYSAVPFSINNFLSLLIYAFHLLGKDKRFLEVGSGSGIKTAIAKTLFDAQGIDINEEHVEFGKKIGSDIFHQDALTFDNYSDYDLIYLFSPFKDDDLQKELEDRIHDQMRKETLIAPIFSAYDWGEFSDMKNHGFLYEKL